MRKVFVNNCKQVYNNRVSIIMEVSEDPITRKRRLARERQQRRRIRQRQIQEAIYVIGETNTDCKASYETIEAFEQVQMQQRNNEYCLVNNQVYDTQGQGQERRKICRNARNASIRENRMPRQSQIRQQINAERFAEKETQVGYQTVQTGTTDYIVSERMYETQEPRRQETDAHYIVSNGTQKCVKQPRRTAVNSVTRSHQLTRERNQRWRNFSNNQNEQPVYIFQGSYLLDSSQTTRPFKQSRSLQRHNFNMADDRVLDVANGEVLEDPATRKRRLARERQQRRRDRQRQMRETVDRITRTITGRSFNSQENQTPALQPAERLEDLVTEISVRASETLDQSPAQQGSEAEPNALNRASETVTESEVKRVTRCDSLRLAPEEHKLQKEWLVSQGVSHNFLPTSNSIEFYSRFSSSSDYLHCSEAGAYTEQQRDHSATIPLVYSLPKPAAAAAADLHFPCGNSDYVDPSNFSIHQDHYSSSASLQHMMKLLERPSSYSAKSYGRATEAGETRSETQDSSVCSVHEDLIESGTCNAKLESAGSNVCTVDEDLIESGTEEVKLEPNISCIISDCGDLNLFVTSEIKLEPAESSAYAAGKDLILSRTSDTVLEREESNVGLSGACDLQLEAVESNICAMSEDFQQARLSNFSSLALDELEDPVVRKRRLARERQRRCRNRKNFIKALDSIGREHVERSIYT